MRIKSVLVILAVFILIPISSMASEVNAGEDVNPANDEAPFTIAERTSPSVDGDVWSLSIVMNDEEAANETEFELTTQVCTNDGVCDPPVKMDAEKRRQHILDIRNTAVRPYLRQLARESNLQRWKHSEFPSR